MAVAGSEATIWHRLQEGVAGLHPGYFALVMATGILSTTTLELQLASISTPLLFIAAAGYLVLCVLTGWRLLQFPHRVLADATAPERAFAFFTFVAGSDVLGLRLAAAGQLLAAAALALLAAAGWLLLSYAIPLVLILAPAKAALSEAVNGTWLIWVVGTQSLAGAAATFASMHPAQREALALAAAGLWGFGTLLYLLLITIIMLRLLLVEVTSEQLTPPYWITMGATAITVFAAARILAIPGRLPVSSPTLSGLALMLWAFGSWWIPLLVLLGVWRQLLKRLPLSYEPTLWSMVFPLGMYAAASQAFGHVAGIAALELIARVEIWFGLAAWLATFVGMAAGLRRIFR